jgi:ribosomal protein S18 acetylase RimI-like enzyme
MKLTEKLIPEFLEYVYADQTAEQRRFLSVEWKNQIKNGVRDLQNYFLTLGPHGKANAGVFVEHFHEQSFSIHLTSRMNSDPDLDGENVEKLIDEAVIRLRELGAKEIEVRVVETPRLMRIPTHLLALGFKQSHARIEFRGLIADLPDDKDTPLRWFPIAETGDFTLSVAAKMLETAGDGDSDWGTAEKNLKLLQTYLKDPEFNSKFDSIQIGQFDGKLAAIIVAQVIPTSGWSRITYMGILPEFRRKGLGTWVHRHGFAMMRAQGGRHYHGGTLRGNKPMESLFRREHCKEYRTMEVWNLKI